ncbi:MAG: DNA gyrase subunit A [Candidatus Abawacabacteria bacterium RBG_16_42_10]|uniref:DNA gyrase subunit A n=1 Tax=Candidatus Abawacabacteria bacterium RBG_16_42_10 TaxID=1817814 RepID=A0A1F4XIM2_9BACT|nr:MAG: DNA gyrase subunit A [Candidatus Abawacabacteria bacterium RBG_16_42_10]
MENNENLLGSMEIGQVTPRELVVEMQESYLKYAMSVIVSRALPDARDGLKPVQRRIIYAMHDTGLRSTAKYRKSAKIVGDVISRFHPHGDQSIYSTMVRMAQPFSLRYPLVDGQGNYGSIDGDSAAAYRYTEARMTSLAEQLGSDIEKETVDFRPNYDATENEPAVLPTRIPNLLLNGSEGIAVGLATKIPPHNLGEVIDGINLIIDKPDCTIEELMEKIPGPDLPTAGVIYGGESLREGYLTGRGSFTVRGVAEIEEKKNGRFDIIITEIPYQVNKAVLIEKIADLVNDKKIVGISDLRDESDDKIRIVIELKKDAFAKKILNQLFEYTQLQLDFHMNMIALVDGLQPRLMTLKGLLEAFIGHRRAVIIRRTEYELRVAKDRAHILEGLNKALDHIDEIISTIKKASTKEEASLSLQQKFKLSERQAQAILEMKLQQLSGLERKKIQDEYQKKLALIKELESILASPAKITKIVKTELAEIKEKYSDVRRTKLMKRSLKGFSEEDLIPDEPMVVTLTKGNYIKRLSPTNYRSQHRGGKGITGITTKEEDSVDHILTTTTHTELFFFTTKGRVFRLKAWEIPLASRTAKGQAIVNLLQLQPEEKITIILPVEKNDKTQKYYFMATTGGTVKKTEIADFSNVRASGLIAIKLKGSEQLSWVEPTTGNDDLILVTEKGQSVLFHEKDVRPMGRASQGVRGIRLKDKDTVVQLLKIPDDQDGAIFVLGSHGYGKKTNKKEFSAQKRGGSGVRISKVTTKTGNLVGAAFISKGDMESDIMVTSSQGQIIRLPVKSIPSIGRATQGVIIMRLDKGDSVSSFAVYLHEESEVTTKQQEPALVK